MNGVLEAGSGFERRGRPCCLGAGTMIEMSDGTERPIEELSEGDSVRTTSGYSRIWKVTRAHVSEIVKITDITGTVIYATPEHAFLTMLGFSPVHKCDTTTKVQHDAGGWWIQLDNLETVKGEFDVYGLSLEQDACYFANTFVSCPQETEEMLMF